MKTTATTHRKIIPFLTAPLQVVEVALVYALHQLVAADVRPHARPLPRRGPALDGAVLHDEGGHHDADHDAPEEGHKVTAPAAARHQPAVTYAHGDVSAHGEHGTRRRRFGELVFIKHPLALVQGAFRACGLDVDAAGAQSVKAAAAVVVVVVAVVG